MERELIRTLTLGTKFVGPVTNPQIFVSLAIVCCRTWAELLDDTTLWAHVTAYEYLQMSDSGGNSAAGGKMEATGAKRQLAFASPQSAIAGSPMSLPPPTAPFMTPDKPTTACAPPGAPRKAPREPRETIDVSESDGDDEDEIDVEDDDDALCELYSLGAAMQLIDGYVRNLMERRRRRGGTAGATERHPPDAQGVGQSSAAGGAPRLP